MTINPDSPKETIKHQLFCAATDIFEGEFIEETTTILSLLQRSSENAESNSVLLIGPRGCGKTTMVNKIIKKLLLIPSFAENSGIVSLSGLIHVNDRVALKSITRQLELTSAIEGKIFGSFAENLAFLLDCLKSGAGKTSKSVIFILDEFDLFCAHNNQTLLYNLFDVAQSAQTPICVIGITHRLDVVELLEKRVKSRFSHRQIFFHPKTGSSESVNKLQKMLFLPKKIIKLQKIPKKFIQNRALVFLKRQFEYNHLRENEYWNPKIEKLLSHQSVKASLEIYFDCNQNLNVIKNLAFEIVSLDQLSAETVVELVNEKIQEHKLKLICDLSVLEVTLLIAMNHHRDIYDGDAFNFEMIFGRFIKFANSSTTMQGLEKPTISKAYEHLKKLELITPITGISLTKVLSPFQLHRLELRSNLIKNAVAKYQNLPTEISQWAISNIV